MPYLRRRRNMHIERPAPRIGAIVSGIDVKRLGEDEWRTLYRLWLEHNVLVVRGQELDPAQFLAYSRRFGRLKAEIAVVQNAPLSDAAAVVPAQAWHTDEAWDRDVCKATQLYAIEVPSTGGDTRIASMYAAYDALPESLRRRIEGLRGEFAFGARSGAADDLLGPGDARAAAALHPLVRVHAETGRRSLYVNPVHIVRIVGLAEAESEQLIDDLLGYMVQPGAEYRHAWQPGDVVVWDNRSSVHANAGGYRASERRVNWRVTVMENESASSLGRAA